MRMMLKVKVPAERGTQTIQDGSMQKILGEMMAKLKPEASYFTAQDGQRCAFIFFDMTDVTDLPSITEPMWMSFGADIELVPVMNADDLQAGLQKAFGG